jgi:hypothetical protein
MCLWSVYARHKRHVVLPQQVLPGLAQQLSELLSSYLAHTSLALLPDAGA